MPTDPQRIKGGMVEKLRKERTYENLSSGSIPVGPSTSPAYGKGYGNVLPDKPEGLEQPIDMGSRDVRHDPNQLALFMTANDLKDTITDSWDRGMIREYPSHYGLSQSDIENPSGYVDYDEEESMEDLWGRKLAESKKPEGSGHGSGVHESISTKGWRPIVSGGVDLNYSSDDDPEYPDIRLSDAHHRVAAAADIESKTGKPIWMGVEHHDPEQQLRFREQRAQMPHRREAEANRKPRPVNRLTTSENAEIQGLLEPVSPPKPRRLGTSTRNAIKELLL